MKRVSGSKGKIFKANEDPIIPTGMLWFTILTGLTYIIMLSSQLKNLDSKKDCQNGHYDTWKMAAYLSMGVAGLGIVVPLGIFVYRRRDQLDEERRAKKSALSSVHLSRE